jgi:hypothetical protein
MEKPFVFRLPKDEAEFAATINHISDHMFSVYGARPNPHETPEHLFVVSQGERIISTLGVDFGHQDKNLTFEKAFSFQEKDLPFSYEKSKTIFFSRWTTKKDYFGVAVWCLASRYALERGCVVSSAIGKPDVLQLMGEYGCKWYQITGAQLVPVNISDYDKAYYFSNPRPMPYLGLIKNQITKMSVITDKLIEKGQLIVEL